MNIEEALEQIRWYQPIKKWKLERALVPAQVEARDAKEEVRDLTVISKATQREQTYNEQISAQTRAKEIAASLELVPEQVQVQQKRDSISNLLLSDAFKSDAAAKNKNRNT